MTIIDFFLFSNRRNDGVHLTIHVYIILVDDRTGSFLPSIRTRNLPTYSKINTTGIWNQRKMNLIFQVLLLIHEHVLNTPKENFLAKSVYNFD